MKLFKLFLIIILPLIMVRFIYIKLSPAVCFSPTDATSEEVEEYLSNNLKLEYKNIQNFAPIIQFGNDWFKYDVFVENKFKVAFVNEKTNFYSEATTELTLMTQVGTSTIPYGNRVKVAEGLKVEEIPKLITGLIFTSQPKETVTLPPLSSIDIQTNNSWPICLYINLQRDYQPLIWLVCLVFLMGILALTRQIITIIYKDNFWKYLKSE